MPTFIIPFMLFVSIQVYAQNTQKPDPNSQINAEEQIHGLPGGSVGGAYSVRTKKNAVKMPSVIKPVENQSPANCASSLGGTGSANYTACEAAKKTR